MGSSCASPSRCQFGTIGKHVKNDLPLAKAKELIVNIPVDDRGYSNIYIHDTLGISLDIPGSNNIELLSKAVLLAIFVLACPCHENKPIPKEEMVALAKLLAEAGPEEVKIILGWCCDFRRMLIAPPLNKFVA